MELYRLIGFAAAAAVLSFTVRRFNEQAGQGLAVAASALVMLSVLAALTGFFNDLRSLLNLGGVLPETLTAAMKAVGIAYAVQLSASICRDLGENSLASACETVGRVMLVLLALPIVRSLAETLISLVESVL